MSCSFAIDLRFSAGWVAPRHEAAAYKGFLSNASSMFPAAPPHHGMQGN